MPIKRNVKFIFLDTFFLFFHLLFFALDIQLGVSCILDNIRTLNYVPALLPSHENMLHVISPLSGVWGRLLE